MLYFKNSELAYTYHVSVRTVRNWIEAVKQGKLDLDLHTHAGRQYVSNTARNIAAIERMVEDRKKYRPHRAVKIVTPRPEFYKLYNESQIYDIVSNLEIHHEIPRDYNYFDKGASDWDLYAQRLANEDTPNLLTNTVRLLEINQDYIDSIVSKYEKVNIVDVGVGNALPVRKLIDHFLKKGILGRYIAIDISKEMLGIARKNVMSWFGDAVTFEDYILDVNRERFSNVLAEDYIRTSSGEIANIVLFLGGTIQNFRKPDAVLGTINDSLGANDILIHTQKLDTDTSRKYFDFSSGNEKHDVPEQNKVLIDLLNIDPTFYSVEMGYDEKRRERFISVKLKVALAVEFEFRAGRKIVNLNKGESILLWRARQDSVIDVIEQLTRNEFYPLQVSQTPDYEYLLAISKITLD